MRFTKQGVRDLNALPSKRAGRKIKPNEWPGAYAACSHRNREENSVGLKCCDCGVYVEVWTHPDY